LHYSLCSFEGGNFTILRMVDEALRALDSEFNAIHANPGRDSFPPLMLRIQLLMAFYTIRSVRQLVEQIDYNRCSAGSWASPWMIVSGLAREPSPQG